MATCNCRGGPNCCRNFSNRPGPESDLTPAHLAEAFKALCAAPLPQFNFAAIAADFERVAMANAYFQAAMSEYLAEEARAADMAPLHEQMFGHALEPDPDFSCNGVETDYPGGPLVIEKSGADEAVRAVMDERWPIVEYGQRIPVTPGSVSPEVQAQVEAWIAEQRERREREVVEMLWTQPSSYLFKVRETPPAERAENNITAITRDIARGG